MSESCEFHIFNPANLPIEDLPIIYAFADARDGDNVYGSAMDPHGEILQVWVSSSEEWLKSDLGCLPGLKPKLHEEVYQRHLPGGYRMEFVFHCDWETNSEFCEYLEKLREPA